MLKHKRILRIILAVVFVIVLFLIKTKTSFKNEGNVINQEEGLTYKSEVLRDLVNKDTDGDGILDWEESLWGTDPAKKDTDGDGVPDGVEIEKLKKQTTATQSVSQKEKPLTETDKFAQELFTTVATLNQEGEIDQATVDKLSNSLAKNIQNSTPKKVFTNVDIKVISDNSKQAIQNYQQTLGTSYTKHTIHDSVIDILAESMKGGEDINVKILNKLDPIIKHFKGIIDEMLAMNVPESLAQIHLETINAFERVKENITDIKLIGSDVILAIGAISQYEKNDEDLKLIIEKLINEINKKIE